MANLRAVVILGAIGLAGAALASQGWKARVPDRDVIRFLDAAHEFVDSGRIPDRGTTTTYYSYSPPGAAWLVVPGVLAFRDLRLYELPGSLALYVGTLAGIFLLGRAAFGERTGYLAVVLYAFSRSGLFLAGTVWPRGHPFFYVWMAYWTFLWTIRRQPRYASAAFATGLAGMYVYLELTPALLMLPAVWVFYRPPVSWKSLATVTAAALLLWFPYLQFEMGRQFADLRSQLTLSPLRPVEKFGWCDPSMTLLDRVSPLPVNASPESTPFSQRLLTLVEEPAVTLGANFEGSVPLGGLLLASLTLAAVAAFARRRRSPTDLLADQATQTSRRTRLIRGCGLLIAAAVLNERTVARFVSWDGVLEAQTVWAIRVFQAALILTGVMIVIGSLFRGQRPGFRWRQPETDARPVVLALIVPWLVLLILTEPGLTYRFVGLWSLQAIVLAAFWASWSTSTWVAPLHWLGTVVLVALVALNPLVTSRLVSWHTSGWAGTESPVIQLADFLAADIRSKGRTSATIGSRLAGASVGDDGAFFELPDVAYPGADKRGKVGGVLDAVLEYREAMANTNQCAEGVSVDDVYKIIERRQPLPGTSYVEMPNVVRGHPLGQFGDFTVFRIGG